MNEFIHHPKKKKLCRKPGSSKLIGAAELLRSTSNLHTLAPDGNILYIQKALICSNDETTERIYFYFLFFCFFGIKEYTVLVITITMIESNYSVKLSNIKKQV